jgi:hypothetical protein
MDGKHLATYLNDHLGGSTAGLELAKRTRDNNEGTEFEPALARIATEIEEDRDALIAMIQAVGAKPDPIKRAVAWTGEKLARAKPNGALTGYSPLSRLIEFETLMLGVSGKLALWHALADVDPPSLRSFPFDELIERAERQRDELARCRIEAARTALGSPTAATRR